MTLTQIGLLIDVIGVLILFEFGLPSKYKHIQEDEILGLNRRPEADIEKEKRKNKVVMRWAYLGLGCLLLGFLFQFIGSF